MNHATGQFAKLRQRMVDKQLRARGVRDPRVLAAMLAVPREKFLPDVPQAEVYADSPQSIGAGQTISQPFTVAYMAEAAELRDDSKILEVGTGSGYAAAVFAHLSTEVHTIERLLALGERAADALRQLSYSNVHVHIGDGSLGLAEQAPFDAIIVAAGAASLPPAYSDQLAEGGRIVIPIGSSERNQRLYRFRRKGNELSMDDLGAFAFVPLIGVAGWHSA